MSAYYDGPRIFDDRDRHITINVYCDQHGRQSEPPEEEPMCNHTPAQRAQIDLIAAEAGVASEPFYQQLRPERRRRLVEVTRETAEAMQRQNPDVTAWAVRRETIRRLRRQSPKVRAFPYMLLFSILLQLAIHFLRNRSA